MVWEVDAISAKTNSTPQDTRHRIQKLNKSLRIDADTKTGFNQNPVFVYSKLTYKLILIF